MSSVTICWESHEALYSLPSGGVPAVGDHVDLPNHAVTLRVVFRSWRLETSGVGLLRPPSIKLVCQVIPGEAKSWY